jgi:glycosidase
MIYNKIKIILFILLCICVSPVVSQPELNRVEPPFWWAGMQDTSLQILLYGSNLSELDAKTDDPGVVISRREATGNPNYLFLYIGLGRELKPGLCRISLQKDGTEVLFFQYEFRARKPESSIRQGFGWADNIYLIMPDRFANGNPGNDSHPQMLEKVNRSNPDGRHGGDFAGIRRHLAYIQSLGMTALWLNPFLENNQPAYSYHGYAITDLYTTDPRIGSNEEFVALVKDARSNGMKIIMDMVFNHLGDNHWMMKDLPSDEWVHQWPAFTRSNFRAPAIPDPYRSQYDYDKMVKGWFDRHMPDLNQNNPLLADYLIQNSIWWVEYSGIDGIRMDTHQYAYKDFMAEWLKRIHAEYPGLGIVGECWIEQKPLHAYWLEGTRNFDGYESNLRFITDFPLYIAVRESFNDKNQGWEKRAERLYYCLAQDLLYKEPRNNMVFLDNHDLSRFYTACGTDFGRFTIGLAFLYTVRGIPQLFYGTELLMEGYEHDGHGPLRADYPGGWDNDTQSAFTPAGRNKQQNRAWNLVSTLANWRKSKTVIHSGKTLHYIPERDVYTYFRYHDEEKVWVILNYGDKPAVLQTSRFSEILGKSRRGTDIITGKETGWDEVIQVPANTAMVIEVSNSF